MEILSYEAKICWGFIRIDFPIATIPPLLFSITALKLCIRDFGFDPMQTLVNSVYSLIYFVLFLYTFTLSNQVIGVDEDKINKPQRPIPSGMITVEDAKKRLYFYNAVYFLISFYKGVVPQTLMWQAATFFGHFGGGHKNGIIKNFLNSVAGIIPQLAGAWKIMYGEVPDHINQWIIYVAWIMFFLMPIQELRDIPGDKLNGRKTLPIMLGEKF
ncbi:digeranylgeranylglyceryl phosphate synthase [Acrasis kona]|uniref:Digeranylgeranylglyceryl phosphate synthase n=1 Tax=Acrasis kona TaxID=1008807 RepID=A0AAW2Z2Z8_9EUKA